MRRLALVALLVLAGCSDPPESGYVEHKQHGDAYTYITMQCAAYDPKTFVCTVYVPIVNNMPATWELCLRDDKDPKKTGCREVGEVAWNKYQVGDHYPDPR